MKRAKFFSSQQIIVLYLFRYYMMLQTLKL
jgi:hypothetical protein